MGRDASNDIVIDILAIAPSHLKISHIAEDYFVESLSDQFPMLLNGKQTTREALRQGDKIQLGKHLLHYSNTVDFSSTNPDEFNDSPTQKLDSASKMTARGNLQIMNGAEIGRVINLINAVTELNAADTTPAIIAKRSDGYYISRLVDDVPISVNGDPISADTKLTDNAKLNVAETSYIFFIE